MASQFTMTFTASMLYKTAYSIQFAYHSLVWRETNAPIELHMGVVLPFVPACLGPRTKGLFLMRLTVLNLFWINVAASGVGKSVTRHCCFISEPLDFMINKSGGSVPDFEISRFTHPGMYNKYFSLEGYSLYYESSKKWAQHFRNVIYLNLQNLCIVHMTSIQ